jgi:hypothetical protein
MVVGNLFGNSLLDYKLENPRHLRNHIYLTINCFRREVITVDSNLLLVNVSVEKSVSLACVFCTLQTKYPAMYRNDPIG